MSATSSGSTGDFETPGSGAGEPDATGDENGRETFEEPSEAALGSAAADQDLAAETAGYGADITALKAEIEKSLSGKVAEGASYEVQTLDGDNVVGVGLTSVDAEDLVSGAAATGLPGENALAIFTVERTDAEKMQAAVASMAGTSALSTMPLVQIPVGVVDIQPHRFRIRPAPGGVSWGHFRITAGTLGCLVRGNRPPRDRRLMGLTNNHVGANSNNASLGDCIAQPGPFDGGVCPRDQVAILERFVPINFSGGINLVDCATGWAWPDRVRRELIYLRGGSPVFFRVGQTPTNPTVGMLVGKTGRTTQLTQGRVTAINVTINVNFGGGRVAHFRDQIAIRGLSGDFSAGGDSGSLVWHWAAGLRPVGLLFAGGGGTTFANRITRVLS